MSTPYNQCGLPPALGPMLSLPAPPPGTQHTFQHPSYLPFQSYPGAPPVPGIGYGKPWGISEGNRGVGRGMPYTPLKGKGCNLAVSMVLVLGQPARSLFTPPLCLTRPPCPSSTRMVHRSSHTCCQLEHPPFTVLPRCVVTRASPNPWQTFSILAVVSHLLHNVGPLTSLTSNLFPHSPPPGTGLKPSLPDNLHNFQHLQSDWHWWTPKPSPIRDYMKSTPWSKAPYEIALEGEEATAWRVHKSGHQGVWYMIL
ncbi:hypothetical protein EI94DRAFT_1702262 [Lactarius quietus]|nr:hypothetical protein EI94DRAFT_1702262 [Lactarius quietus]